MAKKSARKKPRRVVLGVGYPMFEQVNRRPVDGFQKVMLYKERNIGSGEVILKHDFAGDFKIRLIAEWIQ